MRNDFEVNYLAHHGILGQKWGVRRYQNADGSLTDAGRKHVRSLGEVIKDHKRKKQRKKALEKAREARQKKAEEKRQAEKEQKKAEKFAKEKEKILRSGDAELVLKNRKYLTDAEIGNALNRIRNEGSLREIAAKNQKSGFDKIDSMFKKAKTVGDWVNTGSDVYDSFAKVYNAFLADDNSKLPMIKGDKDKKKDKKGDGDDLGGVLKEFGKAASTVTKESGKNEKSNNNGKKGKSQKGQNETASDPSSYGVDPYEVQYAGASDELYKWYSSMPMYYGSSDPVDYEKRRK